MSTELATVDNPNLPPHDVPNDNRLVRQGQGSMTPAQARVDSVSRTMDAAMNRASTLTLTPEEVTALKADFPDEAFKPGAGGKSELIFIEHAFLRDRMNEVIGMGQWALLRTRPHWAEEYVTEKGVKATRIYADCVMLVRGCMVAEAIGEMSYWPSNASQNYGDAAEGAMTAAFRRCAKNFGVGLQAWKKDWCEGWWQRKRGSQGSQPRQTALPRAPVPASGVGASKPSADTPEAPEAVSEPPTEAPPTPKLTPKQRQEGFEKLLAASKSRFISQAKPVLNAALEYFRGLPSCGIMPNEFLEDMSPATMFPSASVDATPEANHTAIRADRDKHMSGIKALVDAGNQIPGAEVPHGTEDADYAEDAPPAQARKPMPAGAESKRIRLKGTSAKAGTKKNGQPYTKYGVVDSEGVWFNHFQKSLSDKAESLKGQDVIAWFKTSDYGNDLIELEEIAR